MLQVHRGGNHRSETILAQNFSLENGATGRKSKRADFAVTNAAQDSRAVGTIQQTPSRRGGIDALTENVTLHFTLNQESRST